MTLNNNFIRRDIAGEYILVPVGEQTAITSGIITLSQTAVVIWSALKKIPSTIRL